MAAYSKRSGEVVGKRELMEAVWPETFVEEANLNQMIFLLRRARDANSESEYITTVPRRGLSVQRRGPRGKDPLPDRLSRGASVGQSERQFEPGVSRRRNYRGFDCRIVADRQLASRFTNIRNALQEARLSRSGKLPERCECRRLWLRGEIRRPVAGYRAADSRRNRAAPVEKRVRGHDCGRA